MAFSTKTSNNFNLNLNLLLTIFLFIGLATAIASPRTNPSQSQSQPQPHPHALEEREFLQDGTLNCETERSSDYYGIGVRVGIYLTWFTAWIANVAVPSEIPFALDTNAVFLFAILVSMVRCTITKLLLQVDGLLLMHLGGGTIFSVLSIWGYRTCTYDIEGPVQGIRRFGGWGTHFRLLLCMGISTFGLFYWARGIKGSLDPDTFPGCQPIYTFMFSKFRADGPIRGFYIFICVGCMLYFGAMLVASMVAIQPRFQRLRYAAENGDVGYRIRKEFVTGLNQKQLRQIFYFLRIGNFMFIVYSMLLVEFSLNYNHIAGVLGWNGHIFFPSQIIPLIIGSFGFCRVIWVRYQQWKIPDSRSKNTNTYRTLLRPDDRRELSRIYSPKSNQSMRHATERDDKEIDPVMKRQSLALRLLVTWLPWLGVLRWWKSEQSEKAADLESPDPGKSSGSGGRNRRDRSMWSPYSYSTPKPPPTHAATWTSEDTVQSRLGQDLPQIPKGLVHLGTF